MCIDAPESTTNCLSSGLRVDGANRHQFSEGEKNAVLFFSFNFRIFLANFHAASRAHRSCHYVSSWDRSSNFGALGLRWWGSPGQIIPSDGFWSRMSAWRDTALVNRTHRIGFSIFELFRRIVVDFGGSISWKTQPNCRAIFNIATALFSPFFLDLLLGCSPAWRCALEHFSPNLHPFFWLEEQALWRMPFFTEWSGASSFEVILARQSSHFPTWASASGTSSSRCISHILLRRRSWRRIRLCRFCTLIFIVAETAIVSFRTQPVGLTLPTISKNSLYTLFCPWILDHGVLLKISTPDPKILISNFVLDISFSPSFSICDNQVLFSSDESPGHTVPIRSWVSQTLVFLICTILPRCHQVGFSS